MSFNILNHKMEIVLQIFVFYIVWTTSAYAKSFPVPTNEPPPSGMQNRFGRNVMQYNGNQPHPQHFPKKSMNGRMQSSSFHNDIMLPPQLHQIKPHNAPPMVYTMDPVLGAPNPSESHHELKKDVSNLKDHLLMLADAQRSLLDHLKIQQKPSLPLVPHHNRNPYHDHQSSSSSSSSPTSSSYHIEHSRPSMNYQNQPNPNQQQYNNNDNKINPGNQESAGGPNTPYYPPPPPPPPQFPPPQFPPMPYPPPMLPYPPPMPLPMPLPAPELPNLPYGNENYQPVEKPSSDSSNYNQNEYNQHPHKHHSHHHHGQHHHHHNHYGHHRNGTMGLHKGRLGRLIKRRQRIRNRKLNQLNNSIRNGFNKVMVNTQAASQTNATETLEFIKDGVTDALKTGLIVAGVKLAPLIFMGIKMLFQSLLPMTGLAAFTNAVTTKPVTITTNTNFDDFDDDIDDYDYDTDNYHDDKYGHGSHGYGHGHGHGHSGGYNHHGGHKRDRRGRPNSVSKNNDKKIGIHDLEDDFDDTTKDDDDKDFDDDGFAEDEQVDDDFEDDNNDDDSGDEKALHDNERHTKKYSQHHHQHHRKNIT